MNVTERDDGDHMKTTRSRFRRKGFDGYSFIIDDYTKRRMKLDEYNDKKPFRDTNEKWK